MLTIDAAEIIYAVDLIKQHDALPTKLYRLTNEQKQNPTLLHGRLILIFRHTLNDLR